MLAVESDTPNTTAPAIIRRLVSGLSGTITFNQNNTPLPCYGDPRTLSRIEKVFDYAFNNKAPSSTPNLELIEIKGPFKVCGIEVIPIEVLHGKLPVLAFRIGNFAYVTDANYINGSNLKKLEGVETLVIGALRHKPHPTHFNIEQALEIIALNSKSN